MDFYRHFYTYEDGCANIIPDFSRLGFLSTKTNEAVETQDLRYDKTPQEADPLYWHNDIVHSCYIAIQHEYPNRTDDDNRFIYFIRDGSGWLETSYSYAQCIIFSSIHRSTYQSWKRAHSMIFIPLKNGGFLLNVQAQASYNYDRYKEIIRPNLPLVIRGEKSDYVPFFSQLYDDCGYNSYVLIGIPPSNKSALSSYLYISQKYNINSSSSYTNMQGSTSFYNADRDVTKAAQRPYFIISTPGSAPFKGLIPMCSSNTTSQGSMLDPLYLDFNPNTCVLTKAPYENGFIDNLYIMTTCPRSKSQGTTTKGDFFSFEGRNFVNVFGNMVLELPS